MTAIPPPTDSTVSRIWKYWESKEQRFSRRLGASQIGRPCDRELWYSFRWARKPQFIGRMLRLFSKGYIEESCIEADLKGIGVEFLALDPETGNQFEFSELNDHFVCKLDGAAKGFVEAPESWHVVEIKTANQKAFDNVMKMGVEKAKPEHYAQMQVGMGMSGMERAMYIVVNKNDDSIYTERISFNKKEYKRLLQRAKEIIFSETAPDRINESPAWYQCKMCAYNTICHDLGGVSEKNCRTCQDGICCESGGWLCNGSMESLDEAKQKVGCASHKFRREMVSESANNVIDVLGGKIVMDEENLSV